MDKEPPPLKLPGDSRNTFCLPSPDGRGLLASLWVDPKPRLVLLDLTSGAILQEFDATAYSDNMRFTFSPDGKTLATCGRGALLLWEVAGGRGRGRLEMGSGQQYVWKLAFSPDGRLLATLGGPKVLLRLWDLTSGRPVGELDAQQRSFGSFVFSPDGKRLALAERNTALVCEVAALLRERLPETAKPSANDLDALWADLSGADGARAYRAVLRLADSPAGSVPLLKRRLQNEVVPEDGLLRRLIADLGADEFEVRERASRELERRGAGAEPALRRALKTAPDAEVQRRAERLLAKLQPGELTPPSAELVSLRVLEALEYSGTPAARDAIAELAKGAPEARRTQEAKASLERLARRPGAVP